MCSPAPRGGNHIIRTATQSFNPYLKVLELAVHKLVCWSQVVDREVFPVCWQVVVSAWKREGHEVVPGTMRHNDSEVMKHNQAKCVKVSRKYADGENELSSNLIDLSRFESWLSNIL